LPSTPLQHFCNMANATADDGSSGIPKAGQVMSIILSLAAATVLTSFLGMSSRSGDLSRAMAS